jgi:hypothetical protein
MLLAWQMGYKPKAVEKVWRAKDLILMMKAMAGIKAKAAEEAKQPVPPIPIVR